MTERMTSKKVEQVFNNWVEVVGSRVELAKGDHWRLENAPVYGGYRIAVIHSETGGEYNPFGSRRYPGREMVNIMRSQMNLIWIMERKS